MSEESEEELESPEAAAEQRAEPDSAISQYYRAAARRMAARLWGTEAQTQAPTITMVDD